MTIRVVAMLTSSAWALLAAYGAGAAEPAQIEEVVVTAQKRSERLIDVPSSVAAVGAQTMKQLGVQQLSQLSDHVPNLIIASSNSLGSSVNIRGVGADSRNIGFDTRVGVYVDGVYMGQSPALNQELVDLERVEVLRGPQGALFGKNTVAGAINLISRKPSDELETYVSARVGNFDDRQAMVRVNIPLSDTVAAKLSVNRAEREGFTTNDYTGKSVGDRNVLSWRGQLRADLTPDFQILASIDGLKTRERADYGDAITDTFGVELDTLTPRPYHVAYDHRAIDQRDIYGGAIEAAYTLPSGAVLKSITAYRDTGFKTSIDVDYSPADLFWVEYSDKYRQLTEEVQWISPKGERLEYLAGLYLYRQKGETQRTGFAGPEAGVLGLADGARLPTGGDVLTRNVAVFANSTYALTDRLKLGLGFRWSWEKKSVDYAIDSRQMPTLGLATGTFTGDHLDKDFSPTLTVNYAFTPRMSGYLRYAQGYKSGGYNLDFVSPDIFPSALEFQKETARNYEVGFKGDLWERRLSFGMAAFWTEFDNFQVDQFRDLGGGKVAIVIGNAAKVRTRGMELEAALHPMQGLSLNVGLGVLDATFLDFPGGGAGGADISGNRIPGASRYQAALGADYAWPVTGDLEVKLHADYSFRSGYFSRVDNHRSITLLGGTVIPYGHVGNTQGVNVRATLARADDGWEVALWSRNLFNEKVAVGYGNDFFGTLTREYSPPRTWGLEVSAKF